MLFGFFDGALRSKAQCLPVQGDIFVLRPAYFARQRLLEVVRCVRVVARIVKERKKGYCFPFWPHFLAHYLQIISSSQRAAKSKEVSNTVVLTRLRHLIVGKNAHNPLVSTKIERVNRFQLKRRQHPRSFCEVFRTHLRKQPGVKNQGDKTSFSRHHRDESNAEPRESQFWSSPYCRKNHQNKERSMGKQ